MTCSKGTKYILFRSRAIGETLNKYGYNVDRSFKINQFVIGNNYSVNLYFRRHCVNSVNFNLALNSECLKFMQLKVTFWLNPLSQKDSSVNTSRNTFKIHDENRKTDLIHICPFVFHGTNIYADMKTCVSSMNNVVHGHSKFVSFNVFSADMVR